MNPAWSVILFTVSSGAGLGLIFWLAMARLAHAAPPTQGWWISLGIGVFLLTFGLLSSTHHLANPRNAWRSFARFATSWLSREGVFAVLLYVALGLYVFALLSGGRGLQSLIGVVVMALCLAVLFCTGMIYACLKTIPFWNNWQTAAAYPVLGLFSGALWLTAVVPPAAAPVARWMAIVLLLAGLVIKLLLYRRMRLRPALGTLDALRQRGGAPSLLDSGHSHPTWLNREFGYVLGRFRAGRLRLQAMLLTFALPGLLLLFAPWLAWLAVISAMLGLLLERWLFFAEAQHVVRLYQGDRRV